MTRAALGCALGLIACSGSGEVGVYELGPGFAPPTRSSASPGASTTGAVASRAPAMRFVVDQTGADNPAGASRDDAVRLIAGGPPGALQWLYPYEGTVFPRGTLAPTLMWQGPVPDAVYLHMQSIAFEYRGLLKPASDTGLRAPLGLKPVLTATGNVPLQPQLPIPQDVWVAACALTRGKADTFTLQLTTRQGDVIAGPIDLHIEIAQANVKTSIYYNSYRSEVGSPGLNSLVGGGKVLRIPPGGQAELVTPADHCTGCHSVSANGARMIAQTSTFGVAMVDVAGNLTTGATLPEGQGVSYALGAGMPDLSMPMPAGVRASFGALYPDGSKYLATALFADVGGQSSYQPTGTPAEASLFDLTSGQPVANVGIPQTAMMPTFSPDGTRLVFTDFAIDSAHGLGLMDYDTASDRASAYRVLFRGVAGDAKRPGFPVFLPDDRAVVFVQTDSSDFTATRVADTTLTTLAQSTAPPTAVPDTVPVPSSDLYIVDADTGQVTLLAQAMGFATPDDALHDQTYLPFGANDLHHNDSPTISPVAAGGYFWVFFDSLRNFGNLGLQRQLWGAAIDIQSDGHYTSDPSHPPFYLPGQELGDSNHRAFAALEPCKADGAMCTSGIDCCSGACDHGVANEASDSGVCHAPQQDSCVALDEACHSTSDCCQPDPSSAAINFCIAGFCAFVDPL